MKAIILAAGEGVRLRPHTLDRPKCLVELAGRPLLDHQLTALGAAGIEETVVVTGYRADKIEAYGYRTRHNPDFACTNMVASLMRAADVLDGTSDVVIAYGDLVYEPNVIAALCACDSPICTTVNLSWLTLWRLRMDDPLCDAESLKMNSDGEIIELGQGAASLDEIQGQYMGLIKIRKDFARRFLTYHEQMRESIARRGKDISQIYMTTFLQWIIDHGRAIQAVPLDGGWLEVDTASDLELYGRLHREGRLDQYCRLAGREACLQP